MRQSGSCVEAGARAVAQPCTPPATTRHSPGCAAGTGRNEEPTQSRQTPRLSRQRGLRAALQSETRVSLRTEP